MSQTNQYYTLNLGTIQVKHSRQSCYRYWNRLHRFQKTVVLTLLLIFIVFVITHFLFHEKTIKTIPDTHKHEEIQTREPPPIIPPSSRPEIKFVEERKTGRVIFKGPSNLRQTKVVNAFLHAWKAYKEHAFGEDELRPISKTKSSWFNLGLSIIDALDTMYIMNLQQHFDEARHWIANSLNLDSDRYNNLFELTIRVIGGLLSAYHLSGDDIFLKKAYDAANRTLVAFDTPSQIPLSDVNLMRRAAKSPHWTTDSSISEVATIQIEFRDLARLTKDTHLSDVVERISKKIHELNKYDGLVPIFINTNTGHFSGNTITFGARGDSYYEYLLKQWMQFGAKSEPGSKDLYLLEDWIEAVHGMKAKLVRHTKPNNLTFIGESIGDSFSPKMDHLVCFMSGNLALGSTYLRKIEKYAKEAPELLKLAEELAETCYQMYAQTQTGLSPEIVYFNTHEGSDKDLYIKPADRHNLLRPETVESLYYLYRITGNKKYQDYGWKIFEAFEKYTKVEGGGYTSIDDVTNPENTRPRDKMESYFLAETLKYFYLLFDNMSEPNIDLSKWMFNTEAHLLPIYDN